MNDILKVIEERFVSKKQQRYFYAKANDKTLSKKERNEWKKRAEEFAEKTNFKKLPEKVETDVDEVVDEFGNIISGGRPANSETKGVTSKSTTDQAMKTGYGQMGAFGTGGAINTSRVLKYWAEEDLSKTLGNEETIKKNKPYKKAKEYFEKDLELDPEEAEEKLSQLGYEKNYPDNKLRLVENPNKYIEEYVDNILSRRSKPKDLVGTEKTIDNPIILKQIKSLKQTLKSDDLNIDDIMFLLRDDDE